MGYDENRTELVGDSHVLLTIVRQCLIMALGALEDYLGMERSIVPRRKRT